MCGIALIVSGIRIDTSWLPFDSTSSTRKTEKLLFSLDDLKAALRRRGPDSECAKKLILQSEENLISSFTDDGVSSSERDNADGIHTAKLHFFGATLQLRGINPLIQPLVDASGNVLVYNGEIFGGFDLESDCNDTEFLMRTLGECCSCGSCSAGYCVECGKNTVLGVLSAIKGPWAIIYWQDSSRTLWFGRDGFGRRSLLVHWPTEDDSTFLLSSVSPVSPVQFAPGSVQYAIPVPAHSLLDALKESVLRRTSLYNVYQAVTSGIRQEEFVPVAILFSGGLDSMILAALLDKCLDPNYEIDLLNVSFDGHLAPDRQSAKAGLNELRRVAPSRKWRLVEIDADLSDLVFETSHVVSLINPANTYMDLNIGIALWLASGGNGWVSDANISDNDNNHVRIKYKSNAKILLVGSGADEQCAGYGRHRTSYRRGSWLGLHEEMRLDMQRIWRRNLGRDDRCIADNGKEARFPFLDEDVIRLLLNMPLWEVANLDQPIGIGDKKILREVAKLLGLYEAAVLPKRAIQFGSRIARESNRKNFGSNRAANQASAGSVRINRKSSFC
ncbi:uncharacterized protein LOC108320630 isoform X2 [Vigna angularis]|uniref:uncharacterized protein LOC108320630 isoform X2 n=1 Tax=Phaseolus angularis TaxID=3914 RepID=UPI0022B46EC1|nr:uncharacterized protein LOC108320630 isoform X2 [Vigna angularis]